MAVDYGSYATAAAGPVGTAVAGLMNRKEAARNRRFQAKMANSVYQRTMADMEKAGLNPILAYQKGGSPSPSGSTGQQPDLGPSAVSALRARQEIKNMKQQERLMKLQYAHDEFKTINMRADSERNWLQLTDDKLKFEYYKKHPTARGISRGMEMFGIKPPQFNFKSR